MLTGGYSDAVKVLWGLDGFLSENFWEFHCMGSQGWDCLMMECVFHYYKSKWHIDVLADLSENSCEKTHAKSQVSILCSPLNLHLTFLSCLLLYAH